MIKNYTFKLSVFSGDLIYLLAGIRHVCELKNTKAEIYLWLNRPWGDSVEGQKHPYGVNQYALDMMRPLVESQPYVACLKEWHGEPINTDLDQLRTEKHSTMPLGSIQRWAGQIWPDMQPDTSKPWIHAVTKLYTAQGIKRVLLGTMQELPLSEVTGKILINRTGRWRNDFINYWFLRDYQDQLIFTGLPEEHEHFCKQWELKIPLLRVKDFLELAVAIQSCRYFIGNQSMCFAIAEAMKVPRLLEICRYAPNVIPEGPGGADFLHQFALEWFVKDPESPFNR
jgi:hypothetical protein